MNLRVTQRGHLHQLVISKSETLSVNVYIIEEEHELRYRASFRCLNHFASSKTIE